MSCTRCDGPRDDPVLVRRLEPAGRPQGRGPRTGQGAVRARRGDPLRLSGRPARRQGHPRLPAGPARSAASKVAEPEFITPAVRTCSSSTRRTPCGAGGRPTRTGKGTLARVKVKDSASWGDDIRAIGTFVRNADQGLYNLYIVDPSAKQILRLYAGRRRVRLPGRPDWLAGRAAGRRDDRPRCSSTATSTSPRPARSTGSSAAATTGWKPGAPGDGSSGPPRSTRLVASGTDKRRGRDLRLRPRQSPDRRAGQGRWLDRGAVPAGE